MIVGVKCGMNSEIDDVRGVEMVVLERIWIRVSVI